MNAIETLIVPRAVDLGEMTVRRALPSIERQMAGPFIPLPDDGREVQRAQGGGHYP